MSQSRVKALSSRVRVSPPANAYRGGWVDTFRSTVLTQLLANINQQGSSAGWTYIDYSAGPDKWDISQSVRRQWGINPVFDYGRAMSVLRHKDERVFMGHPFLGLMRRVREVNSDVVMDIKPSGKKVAREGERTAISKLVPGFKYFPSTAALLKPVMREQDRAILCEKDPEYFHRLATYIGNDHRFKLWNMDAYEEIAAAENPNEVEQARISIPQKLRRGEKQLEEFYAAVAEREKQLAEQLQESPKWEDPKLKKAPVKTPNPDVEAAKAEADRLIAAGLPPSQPAHVAFGEEVKAQNKQANDILRYLGILPMEPAPLATSAADTQFVDSAASPLVPAPPVPQLTARREEFATQEEYELALRIIELQRRIAEREVETFLRVQGVPMEKLRLSIERAQELAPELFARQIEEAALTSSTPASRARLDLQRTIATLEAHHTILTNLGHWDTELRDLWAELSMRIDEANDTLHDPMYERLTTEEEPTLKSTRRIDPLEDYGEERLAELEDLIPLDPHTHDLYRSFQAKLRQAEDVYKNTLKDMKEQIELLKDEQKADLEKLRAAEPLRLDEQLALADLAALRARVVAGDANASAEAAARQRKVALSMAQTTAKEVEFTRLPEELPVLLGQPRQEVVSALFPAKHHRHVNETQSSLALLKDNKVTTFGQLEASFRPSDNPRVVAARAAERQRFAELQSLTQAYLKAKASGVPVEQLDAVAAPKQLAAMAAQQAQTETQAHNAYLDQLLKYSRDMQVGWTKHADSLLSKGRATALTSAQKELEASIVPQQQARLRLVDLLASQGPSAPASVQAKADVARLDTQTNEALAALRASIGALSAACNEALSLRYDTAAADMIETEHALNQAHEALTAAQQRLSELSGMGEDDLTPEEDLMKQAMEEIDDEDDRNEDLLKYFKAEAQDNEALEKFLEDVEEEEAIEAENEDEEPDEMADPVEDIEVSIREVRDELRIVDDVAVMETRVEYDEDGMRDEEDEDDESGMERSSYRGRGRDQDELGEREEEIDEEEEELNRLESEDAPEEIEQEYNMEVDEEPDDSLSAEPDYQRLEKLEDELFDFMWEAEMEAGGEEAQARLAESHNLAGEDSATFYPWLDAAIVKYGLQDQPAAIEHMQLRNMSRAQLAATTGTKTDAKSSAKAGELQVEDEDEAVLPTTRSAAEDDDFIEDDEGASNELSAAEAAREKLLEAESADAMKHDDVDIRTLMDARTADDDAPLTPQEQAEFDAEAEVGEHELLVRNAQLAFDAAEARLLAVKAEKTEVAALSVPPPATPAMQAAPGTRPLTAAEEEERAHRLRYDIAKALREIATLEASMQSDRDSVLQYDYDIPMQHLHIVQQRRITDLHLQVVRLQLELSTEPRDKIRLAKMKLMERPAELDTVEFDQLSEKVGLAQLQQEAVVATNQLRSIENQMGLDLVEQYEQWRNNVMPTILEEAEVAKNIRDEELDDRIAFNAKLRYIQSVMDKLQAQSEQLPASNSTLAMVKELEAELEQTQPADDDYDDHVEAAELAEEHAEDEDEDFESMLADLDPHLLSKPGFVEKVRDLRDFNRRMAEGQVSEDEMEQRRLQMEELYDAHQKEHEEIEKRAKQIAEEREAARKATLFSESDLAQVRNIAAQIGVDGDAAVEAVRTSTFSALTADGTVDVQATEKMMELEERLSEELPNLFVAADAAAAVTNSIMAEDTPEELLALLRANQKQDVEETTLLAEDVPAQFRELHVARERADMAQAQATYLTNTIRLKMLDNRADNDLNLLDEAGQQARADAEQAIQRMTQLAQAEVQNRIDSGAEGMPDLSALGSFIPTEEEVARSLEEAGEWKRPTSITIDGKVEKIVYEEKGARTAEEEDELDAENDQEVNEPPAALIAAEESLGVVPMDEPELLLEHEYLVNMAKTEAIVRRKLLEMEPLAFLDGEARVLQSRVDEMQSELDEQHNARRAETIAKWRAHEDAEDSAVMASLASDATGKSLSIDALEMTMYRRRMQGLSVEALRPVLEAKRQEEVKAVYKKAGEIVAARNKARGAIADQLPHRQKPELPPNPSASEEREWQVQMSLYNKEVAQDRRLLIARRTQEATPEAFKMLRALKENRNPELRRRQQLLASIEAEALKPVAAKAKELGLADLPSDYEEAVVAVRSADDKVREQLFPMLIDARTVMHTLRTESIDQMRAEMAALQQQQRDLQGKLSAAKWINPRHDVLGKELAKQRKEAAALEEQKLHEEMVLAGEMPPVILSEQEQLEAELAAKEAAQYPAVVAKMHIAERLNEIGNDPTTYEARELILEAEARRIALEKAFPHLPKLEQPEVVYDDIEERTISKLAKKDKEWGVIPPEGQSAEVDSADTHFPVNLASAIAKPLTAHAIVGIDIAEAITEGWGFEGDILGVDDLVLSATQQIIEQSVHRFPHATYVITYPIFGRGYQDQLLQAVMKTGVRNIIQGTFHIQKGEPFDTATRVYDFEPWGAGVAIIRPPPGFDKVLKDIVNTMQDVMVAYGPSIHTGEENDAVASRIFPSVDAQANATFFVDRSIHWQDGWPNRPDVSWMTAQVEDHIKNLHSFRWEHFVPSYENPRSKRFELMARARTDMESDLWNYGKGYRGDDESANRWLLVNNQLGRHAHMGVRDPQRAKAAKELRKSKDEAKLTEIMRQTDERRKELRAQINEAQKRMRTLQRQERVADAEAQRVQFEAEAALTSIEAQLKPMRESLTQRLAAVDPADTEAVALTRTEHAMQLLPLRKQKEALMAQTRALAERRSDAEHARLVADAEAEVQSLEAAEQELMIDADLRAEPVVEAVQRQHAVARSMGIEPTQLHLEGHGRDGTKLASPPRDQSKLKPTDRYSASSERPAIDSVDWGFVQAQKRALKRVQDADLAAARDQKRSAVFNMLSMFQRSKIEQQVEAHREALVEAERIAQAKRDGTWVDEEEEEKKDEEEKKRRTPALHSRMARDTYFQRALLKYGQKGHSQMVLPPKKQ